jgi:hypothetical protein
VATNEEVNDDAPVETALVVDVAMAVDAEIARVAVEEQPESGGLTGAGASQDVGEGR